MVIYGSNLNIIDRRKARRIMDATKFIYVTKTFGHDEPYDHILSGFLGATSDHFFVEFVGALWLFNTAMENCPFIDDFPSYKPPFMVGIFHGYVSHNQRVEAVAESVQNARSRLLLHRLREVVKGGAPENPTFFWTQGMKYMTSPKKLTIEIHRMRMLDRMGMMGWDYRMGFPQPVGNIW